MSADPNPFRLILSHEECAAAQCPPGTAVDIAIRVVSATGLPIMDTHGAADPYVVLKVPGLTVQRTKTKHSTVDPEWDEAFRFRLKSLATDVVWSIPAFYVQIDVWDGDKLSTDDHIGRCFLPLMRMTFSPQTFELDVLNAEATTDEPQGRLVIEAWTSGSWDGRAVHRHYESKFREDTLNQGMQWILNSPTPLLFPGDAEVVEVAVEDRLTATVRGQVVSGRMYLTNFRFVFIAEHDLHQRTPESSFAMHNRIAKERLSCQIPLAMVVSVTDSSAATTDGGKVHGFTLRSRDFNVITLAFTNDMPTQLLNSIRKRLRLHCHNNVSAPLADVLDLCTEDQKLASRLCWDAFSLPQEFHRQGIPADKWRVSTVNRNHRVSASYPEELYVPANMTDEMVRKAADFRSKGRLPALTWYHRGTGASMCRSAQPMSGMQGNTSVEDTALLEAIRDAGDNGNSRARCIIVDARSSLAARGNQLRGKGTEDVKKLKRIEMTFMNIPNIHQMRSSFHDLRVACESSKAKNKEGTWLSVLESTRWLEYIRLILSSSLTIAYHIAERGDSVLVHCSDGWDRTSQLCSLAQILLEPYYRTMAGFRVLIEKDWLAFGHKFGDRCGDVTKPKEESPVFVQFLDCVWQIMTQYPASFEFSSAYLATMAQMCGSSWFGTFLLNTNKERTEARLPIKSLPIWLFLESNTHAFLNPLFLREDKKHVDEFVPTSSDALNRNWRATYTVAGTLMTAGRKSRDTLKAFEDAEEQRRMAVPVGSSEVIEEAIVTEPAPFMDVLIPSCSLMKLQLWTDYYCHADELTFLDLSSALPNTADGTNKDKVLWVPNEHQQACYDCRTPFALTRRRHHCRLCGNIFCGKCSVGRRVLTHINNKKPVRVCKQCEQAVDNAIVDSSGDS